MQKSSTSFAALGALSVLCVAVLAACGGGSEVVNFPVSATNTPTPSSTPVAVTPTPTPTPGNGTPTPTPTPPIGADMDCVPGVPTAGQQINTQVTAVDGQAGGTGLYPVGTANVAYTIGAGNTFTISSSNLAGYNPSPVSGSYAASGEITSPVYPALTPANAESTSLITFYPSDWMQQAVKQASLAAVGGVYQTEVLLEAKGTLPNLLAGVVQGSASDLLNNAILAKLTATITRQPNATVASVSNACKYTVTLSRPNIKVDELAALDSYYLAGTDLEPVITNPDLIQFRQGIELYMPMLAGTFATSKDVPFVPVFSDFSHTYGVSSTAPKEDVTTNLGTFIPAKELAPATPAARQTITFVSVQN